MGITSLPPYQASQWWFLAFQLRETFGHSSLRSMISQFPNDQDVGYEREENARVLGLSNQNQIELSFSKMVKLWEEHVCKGELRSSSWMS